MWWAQPQIAKDPAFNHVVFASIMDTKSALSTDLTLVGDHIYTTGQFKGSITVEEGYPLVSQGSMDAFVAKVRASHSVADVEGCVGCQRRLAEAEAYVRVIRSIQKLMLPSWRLCGLQEGLRSGLEIYENLCWVGT